MLSAKNENNAMSGFVATCHTLPQDYGGNARADARRGLRLQGVRSGVYQGASAAALLHRSLQAEGLCPSQGSSTRSGTRGRGRLCAGRLAVVLVAS